MRPCAVRRRGEEERDRGGDHVTAVDTRKKVIHSLSRGEHGPATVSPRGRPMTIHASGNSDSSDRGSTLGTSDHVHLSILVNSLENRQTHSNFWTDSTARLCNPPIFR